MKDELKSNIATIFKSTWNTRQGQVVPEAAALRLGNDAVELDATVLYADLAGSTSLVDNHEPKFAAEVYKSFLTCAARIIKEMGGAITAYDGDRIMAVYIGETKNTSAVKTALNINWAMIEIVRPALIAQYGDKYTPRHGVGIDTSKIHVARIGVKNDNDLVWVGRAANHAAKLCGIRDGEFVSWISGDVFSSMHDSAKISTNGQPMWEKRTWTAMGGRSIYRSNWRMRP